MTPKEKAEELINNFSRTHVLGILNKNGKLVSPYSSGYASIEVRNTRAKNSALIAVDEITNALNASSASVYYWQIVKKEIENL